MKTVKEVLAAAKGEKNVNATLTGKGSFSKQGFGNLVNALANDTSHKVESVGRDGKVIQLNLSEKIRADFKKTAANAKFPQKSEAGVYDTCEIATAGITEAITYAIREQLRCGKKVDIPPTKEMEGSIYLAPVKGRTKTMQVRDMKTKEDKGTTTITTKDSVQIRAKSPVPKALQTKVRRDTAGKIIPNK